jgi:hypothetical protein
MTAAWPSPRAPSLRCALALALVVACGGAGAQELVDRWFDACAPAAARSALLKAWLVERGETRAPRSCFVLNGAELLFLASAATGSNQASVSYVDLRRRGAQPVRLGWGDDEVVTEAGAVTGKHYVLLRTLASDGGVERAGYSLLYLVPRHGGQPPLRLVSLHASTFMPCQGTKQCRGDQVRHVFGDGTGARLELTLPGHQALLAEPKLAMEAGKLASIDFPTSFGGPPLRYRVSQGSTDFAVEDLEGFAGRVKRRFPAAVARPAS